MSHGSPEKLISTSREAGSASIEFLLGGVILLVPLIYLVILLGTLQAQSFAVDSAARHAARTIARGGAEAMQQAHRVVSSIESDYAIEPGSLTITVHCTPVHLPCPSAGSMLSVSVTSHVALPFLSGFGGLTERTSVPVSGTAVHKVSRFVEAGER